MKKIIVILFLIIIISPKIIFSEQHLFKVQVEVSGEEGLKNRVYSYFARELRSLGDVTIVNYDPSYVLKVVVIETTLLSGSSVGYAVSYVLLAPYTKKSFDSFLESAGFNPYDKKFKAFRDSFDGTVFQFRNHLLQTGSPESLRNICEEFVTRFDAKHLEPARIFWRNLNK